MSYQALARKWRPQRFDELVGQEHIVRALQHGLANDRLHHALLFSGTRGVGKTTLGRLVAKGLNCQEGVTATPCGKCDNCLSIEQGRFVDLIEVDAASRTGVDDTRELLNNVQYAPARGRCKVYLIDEVHMLSKSAFNALLKTLEEPPEHVRFLLATTDPQKLPITVLSRCLQFHLKRLPRREIQERLQKILSEEGIEYETGATELLARGADGSLRDGISLLDQAIAFGHGQLKTNEVGEMLGSIARRDIVGLLDALASNDGPALMQAVEALDEQAPDYATALEEMALFLQRMAVIQLIPDAANDDEEAAEDQLRLSAAISAERVQLLYQIAITGKRDLPLAPDPRSGFEMTMLRMLAFEPSKQDVVQEELTPNNHSEKSPAERRQAVSKGTRPDLDKLSDSLQQTSNAPVSQVTPSESSQIASEPEAPEQSTIETVTEPTRTAAPSDALTPPEPSGQAWAEMVNQLGLTGMTDQLARHCSWQRLADHVFYLQLSPSHQSLFGDRHEASLLAALRSRFGKQYDMKIEITDNQALTPAAMADDSARERQLQAEESMAADPKVKQLNERLGAQLHPGSIEALD